VLSEPESRIAKKLILKLRPQITIWFHQPLGLVDLSGGDGRIERRFAKLAGLPVKRLPRYRGSSASWQNRRFAETTAFVTELPAGAPDKSASRSYARAIVSLINQTD
jgi:protein MpaA